MQKVSLITIAILAAFQNVGFSGISGEASSAKWANDAAHQSLLLKIDALEDVLQGIRKGLRNLPEDSPARKNFESAYEASSEAFRLLYVDSIPLIRVEKDWNVSWWMFWYFGNFVDQPGNDWILTIREFCLVDQMATATVKHTLEHSDFDRIRTAAMTPVLNTPEENQEIDTISTWFDSLTKSEAKALVRKASPAKD